MAQPGTISRVALAVIWLLLGGVMIGVPVWLGWTRWHTILNGHPAMMAATLACGFIGFVAVAWSIASLALGGRQDREGDPTHPATGRRPDPPAPCSGSCWLSCLLVCMAVVAGLAGFGPSRRPGRRGHALGNNVVVTDLVGWYEMEGSADKDGHSIKPTTPCLHPGAGSISVLCRLLRPLAQAGYLVAVLKVPFGIRPSSGLAQRSSTCIRRSSIGRSAATPSAARPRPHSPTGTRRSRG
jgi:hypothetical protein